MLRIHGGWLGARIGRRQRPPKVEGLGVCSNALGQRRSASICRRRGDETLTLAAQTSRTIAADKGEAGRKITE